KKSDTLPPCDIYFNSSLCPKEPPLEDNITMIPGKYNGNVREHGTPRGLCNRATQARSGEGRAKEQSMYLKILLRAHLVHLKDKV
ncbi:MAG: hypothetical protein JW913_10745, partial [Chitinispirillaceae bacterium]|nr:hypothetical protein [Chitinispirillaceae bacterium]